MQTTTEFERKCVLLVEALGLGGKDDIAAITPLTGGVSSEIASVDIAGKPICVKFALRQLKVSAEWLAPVRRNAAEYDWISFVSQIAPENVPALFGRDIELGGFAMEFLGSPDVRNWKSELLAGNVIEREIRAVARVLGEIHARSAGQDLKAMGFDHRDDFYSLRVEPYLVSLVEKHPDLSEQIGAVAHKLMAADAALIHGDISPKNILMVDSRPVFLDAECATMGDPAFDVAFCLNHFCLKAVLLPEKRSAFFKAFETFLAEYRQAITWEERTDFEHRVARLLPILFLARVDGKSPVEYLDEKMQATVRRTAIAAIAAEIDDPGLICRALGSELK